MMHLFKEQNEYDTMSQQHVEQISTGTVTQYRVTSKSVQLKDILEELNLNGKFFAVLVDGKRADLEMTVHEDADILILPKIAGG